VKVAVFLITERFNDAAGEDGCFEEVLNKGR